MIKPSKENKKARKMANILHDEKNRYFHHNLAAYELRALAREHNDPLLNEAVERCINIIFQQDDQISQLKMNKIFKN